MVSTRLLTQTESSLSLRPLNVLRDLPAIADLIERCFSSTMDSDGRQYVRDMRRTGSENSFVKWANRVAETTSMPLTGYVWEEDSRVIGNVSLVPFRDKKRRIYLIANVAVLPEYRRRGIARALTVRAMRHAREKKADDVWLHVRADNVEAIHLYQTLGFEERARRTSWHAYAHLDAPPFQTDLRVGARSARFWEAQQKALARFYPDEFQWYVNWNFSMLKPGLLNELHSKLLGEDVRQWAALRGGNFLAALSWIPTERGRSLFAAPLPDCDPQALTATLLQARRDLAREVPSLSLEFPADLFDGAIEDAGFRPQRTLIWMRATS
ncbi:MAG: GNAT family N-acetyltransferase [Anaerolineales bacterium]|nr:GNAT family N-acetyltransferase [Anaerolineales bacterium]